MAYCCRRSLVISIPPVLVEEGEVEGGEPVVGAEADGWERGGEAAGQGGLSGGGKTAEEDQSGQRSDRKSVV